jgi:hypothetical protein
MSAWTQNQLVQSLTAACETSSGLSSLVQRLLLGTVTFTSGAWLTGCPSSFSREALQWTLLRLPDDALDNVTRSQPTALWLQGLKWPEAAMQAAVQKEVRGIVKGLSRKRTQQPRHARWMLLGHQEEHGEEIRSAGGAEASSSSRSSSIGNDSASMSTCQSPNRAQKKRRKMASTKPHVKPRDVKRLGALSAATLGRFSAGGQKARSKQGEGKGIAVGLGPAAGEFPHQLVPRGRKSVSTRELHKLSQQKEDMDATVLGCAARRAEAPEAMLGHTEIISDMSPTRESICQPGHRGRGTVGIPSLSPAAPAVLTQEVSATGQGAGYNRQEHSDACVPRRRRHRVSLDPAFLPDNATHTAATSGAGASGDEDVPVHEREAAVTPTRADGSPSAIAASQLHCQLHEESATGLAKHTSCGAVDAGGVVTAMATKPVGNAGVGKGEFAARMSMLLATSSEED